ncbi:MAG: glycosyltransferase family 2 protein [Caldilineaceae bacterium]|nr:glycosyltransferase family 2 protein [Caldilineaceae bacterium]
MQVAAVILTKNEARHIGECIAAVKPWVKLVVVWDAMSDDATCAMAQAAGAVVVQRPWDNFAAQRQAVLDTVTVPWILFIDADERVTPALGQAVQQVVAQAACSGYWIPRRNFIVGHEMRGGGYFPDYQLRLLKRTAARYSVARAVHETVELAGEAGWLAEPLLHINYESWAQFHRKQRFYAAYEAQMLQQRQITPRLHNFILQPLREFRRRLITLAGWRDGWPGLRLALFLAWYYGFMPYWLLLTRSVG